MSYIIEVYKGNQKAERHFGKYSLYVMFYPQLVAGPIERPQNVLPQLHLNYSFDYDRVVMGLKLMAWGMFKKVVIADRLAIIVDEVYNNPENFRGIPLIISTIFFSFQIYCDFSGYSDIAIGSARVMGVDLMKNFRSPYFSKTISEFWKRWHISLSTWFRDYLYIPLGGNRVPKWKWLINLFVIFLVSGVWHGANWTFVIWGALHGLYMIINVLLNERLGSKNGSLGKTEKPALRIFKIAITFSIVTFAWIFFRANNMSDALYIVNNMFVDLDKIPDSVGIISKMGFNEQNTNIVEFALALFGVVFLLTVEYVHERFNINNILKGSSVFSRWAVYLLFILSILVLGRYSTNQFIYFQF